MVLVLPKGSTSLRNALHLRLVRRYAAALGQEVVLVSGDGRTRELAAEQGLAATASLWLARLDLWRNGPPRRSPAQRAAAMRVASLRSGRKDPGYRDRAIVWGGRLLGAVLFLLLAAVIVGIAVLVVPEAQITLVPYRQSVETTLQLTSDPDAEKASLESLTVPARLVEVQVEETGATATVNKKDAPDRPATGTVTFINQAPSARDILTGTIVRTSTGTTVRFRTVSTATLEARVGATAVVRIEALEPGPVGNVQAATINTVETAALRGKVRVINDKATAGGGVKQVGVVTRADMDRLKAQLLEQLQQEAYQELLGKLGDQEFLPLDSMTVEIMSEVYDQFLDAEADVLHLTMRIDATGTAVDKANAKLLAYDALKAKIPSTYQLTSDQIEFKLSNKVQMDGRKVRVDATASATLVAEVDRRVVRSAAAGKTEARAVQALMAKFALDAPPEVEVRPEWIKRWSWLDRVPLVPFRIQVVVLK